jgi:hypothetical protein
MIIELAREYDEGDTFLIRELQWAGASLVALASYVDGLVDMNGGVPQAYESLRSARRAGGVPTWDTPTLSDCALELMVHLSEALASAQARSPVFVDATGSASDIVRRLARTLCGRTEATVVTSHGDDAQSRGVRRQLAIYSVRCRPSDWPEPDAFVNAGPALHIARYPTKAQPLVSEKEILSSIDLMVLRMTAKQLAVVMAPASILTDAGLSAEAEELRKALLRSGHVRAVVRLPVGLVLHKPQQAQALWVLDASHSQVALTERLTLVADLTSSALTEPMIGSVCHRGTTPERRRTQLPAR